MIHLVRPKNQPEEAGMLGMLGAVLGREHGDLAAMAWESQAELEQGSGSLGTALPSSYLGNIQGGGSHWGRPSQLGHEQAPEGKAGRNVWFARDTGGLAGA